MCLYNCFSKFYVTSRVATYKLLKNDNSSISTNDIDFESENLIRSSPAINVESRSWNFSEVITKQNVTFPLFKYCM